MITWLWNIIIGQFCHHKWEIIAQCELQDEGVKVGMQYMLQCKKCGNVKKRNL